MKTIKKTLYLAWKILKIFLILFLVYFLLSFCYELVSDGYDITITSIGKQAILENKDYEKITEILSKTVNENLSKMTLCEVNEKYDDTNNKIATEYIYMKEYDLLQEIFLGDKVISLIIDIYYDDIKNEVVEVKKIFGDSVVFYPYSHEDKSKGRWRTAYEH